MNTVTPSLSILNEWEMAITSQSITELAGVAVTQGAGATAVAGTLKYNLNGDTTVIVVQAAAATSFITTADLIVGSTTIVLANINAAVESSTSLTGTSMTFTNLLASTTYQLYLTGKNSHGFGSRTTPVLFTTLQPTLPGDLSSRVSILNSTSESVMLVWTSPSFTGGRPTLGYVVEMEEMSLYSSQLIYVGTATNNYVQNEWTLSIASQTITENIGVTVSQNEFTLTITSQIITENAGVTVMQGTNTVGTLKTGLTGASTSFVVAANAGVTFVETMDIIVGGIEHTLTITAQTITESAGVTVTQGSGSSLVTGTLKTALTGVGMVNVVIESSATSEPFVTTADLIIGSTTVVHANVLTATQTKSSNTILASNIISATNSIHAIGTLKTALVGGSTSVVINAKSEIAFVTTADVIIGSTTVLHANINAVATNAEWTFTIVSQSITENVGVTVTQGTSTGILKTTLTGTGMTTIVIQAVAGVSFAANLNLVVGSTTVLSATITAASSSIPMFQIGHPSISSSSKCLPFDTTATAIQSELRAILPPILWNPLIDVSVLFAYNDTTTTKVWKVSNLNFTRLGVNEWMLGITPQQIGEKNGVVVSQNEWSFTITSQAITESVGVTVTQGSGALAVTGTLKTALTGAGMTSVVVTTVTSVTFDTTADLIIGSTAVVHANILARYKHTATGSLHTTLINEWTLAIASQAIVENNGVLVQQGSVRGTLMTAQPNEWILTITSQDITASTGIRVTQGNNIGLLKTALTGTGMTSVVIETMAGVTLVATADLVIGSTTVVHANIATAVGTTTSVVISATSGASFLNDADVILGGDEWTLGITAQGITENMGTKVIQNEWTMAIASQAITENVDAIVSQNEWTLAIGVQAITESIGVAVTQGSVSGILKAAVPTRWQLSITSQSIIANAGVTVTQGSGGSQVTGTLTTDLNGATTTIVIETVAGVTFLNSADVVIGTGPGTTVLASSIATAEGQTASVIISTGYGVIFVSTADVVIGSTTVLLATVNSATQTLSVTGTLHTVLNGDTTSIVISTNSDVAFITTADLIVGSTTIVTANVNTATNSLAIAGTLKASLVNEWTMSITAQAITKVLGVGVTQGTGASLVSGRLKIALDGATTTIVITTTSDMLFSSTTADLVVGGVTVAASNINSATHTGATTSFVVQTAVGVVFVPTSNVILGSTTILKSNVATATKSKTATTILASAITTATNSQTTSLLKITAPPDITFVTTSDLMIGSTTVLHANINTFENVKRTGEILPLTIQKCDSTETRLIRTEARLEHSTSFGQRSIAQTAVATSSSAQTSVKVFGLHGDRAYRFYISSINELGRTNTDGK